jgi:hypothetical protein
MLAAAFCSRAAAGHFDILLGKRVEKEVVPNHTKIMLPAVKNVALGFAAAGHFDILMGQALGEGGLPHLTKTMLPAIEIDVILSLRCCRSL